MDKQIEEMAKVIRVNCGECYTCKYLNELHCADLLSAENLYNAGYRKIPENAVVLTEWEYEYFQKEIRYWQEQYHKESEKFIKFVGETFKEKQNED